MTILSFYRAPLADSCEALVSYLRARGCDRIEAHRGPDGLWRGSGSSRILETPKEVRAGRAAPRREVGLAGAHEYPEAGPTQEAESTALSATCGAAGQPAPSASRGALRDTGRVDSEAEARNRDSVGSDQIQSLAARAPIDRYGDYHCPVCAPWCRMCTSASDRRVSYRRGLCKAHLELDDLENARRSDQKAALANLVGPLEALRQKCAGCRGWHCSLHGPGDLQAQHGVAKGRS